MKGKQIATYMIRTKVDHILPGAYLDREFEAAGPREAVEEAKRIKNKHQEVVSIIVYECLDGYENRIIYEFERELA